MQLLYHKSVTFATRITGRMILENFIKFIKYFGDGKRLQLVGFVGLASIAGCLEFVGIALIYPFILMIIRPETVTNTSLYLKFSSLTGITEPIINALLIGFMALVLFVLKNVYMVLFIRLQSKFLYSWQRRIAGKFMEYFLFASYKDLLKVSNSDKYYILNSLCGSALNSFVMRILMLMTNSFIVTMVILLILVKFPIAGVTTITFSLVTMLLQNKFLKNKTRGINEKIQRETQKLNSINCSNVENVKEIKIISAETKFFDNYNEEQKLVCGLQSDADFYAGIPPYVVEILIVTSLLILGSFIAFSNLENQSAMVASFALVVASIFRIAPALNRIQTAIINIGIGRSYIKKLLDYYEKFDMANFVPNRTVSEIPMRFNNKIELKNIDFSYIEKKPILKDVSIEINKGDFIGIIGLSGSGKTTLADILMGLLPQKGGEILVDGVKLTENNYSAFRNLIGYVPQDVKILEASFRENIAWGIPIEKIEDEKVWQAINVACLAEFVDQFADGIYATPFVGANGASQGQKQRIALARALYRNPEILILDEATSSLDVKVEHEITSMLTDLKQEKTIIAIAHRLSTLKECNKLVYIKDGRVVDIGTFGELSAKYEDFSTLLKLSSIN